MADRRFVELCDDSPGSGRRWIPVVPLTMTSDTPAVVGVIQAGNVRGTFEVCRRDARTKAGYQRELSSARVGRLVRDLREDRVDLPSAILLNLRDFLPERHLAERPGGLYFRHDPETLYVVDGQHRVEALARLVDEDKDRWGGLEVPFVCLLGASENQERRHFHVVNSTSKRVPTDLTLDLLRQRADAEPGLVRALTETGETWKVDAQRLVEQLAATRLWRCRIRFPGDPKGETTVGSASMVTSLRPVLTSPYFGAVSAVDQVRILDAYWHGIEKVVPECFACPQEYTLQMTIGVSVLHCLLVSVLECVRSADRSVVEPEVYADILNSVLPDLESDTIRGESARGPDFWLGAREGAAASYSSSAGRRVLIAQLRAKLPPIVAA